MIFFNNSLYRGYIGGNIIVPNTIYMVDNFNTFILDHIRNSTLSQDIIILLNKMFSPIVGTDTSYPSYCEKYFTISFSKMNNSGHVIVNNNNLEVNSFIDSYKNYKFSIHDIVLLEMNIEYIEQIEKGNV